MHYQLLLNSRIKWSDIELPKEMGGLGVGNIMHKNMILLFKWWWRFSESDNSIGKNILKSVHDIKGLKASSETFSKIREGTWSHFPQIICNITSKKFTDKSDGVLERGILELASQMAQNPI